MSIIIPQYTLDGLGGEYLKTREVEEKIAAYVGAKHCIMVSNGTVAIFLALRSVGAKKVAIPALTMFGTIVAAELAGCEVVLVANNELPEDVDTYIHVSLNGRHEGVAELQARYPKVRVIEDSAQSLGSQHQGKFLGTFGVAGCYSFSPHKIISAGNGGCVVTNDDDIAHAVRCLKNFGRAEGGADTHDRIGYNFKFTDILAEFMLPQLAELDQRIARKKELYAAYYKHLSDNMLPHESVPWFVDYYVDKPEDRAGFVQFLKDRGIGTRLMYPHLNTQKSFAHLEIYGDSIETTRRAATGVWLPSYLTLTDADIATVVSVITEWRHSL